MKYIAQIHATFNIEVEASSKDDARRSAELLSGIASFTDLAKQARKARFTVGDVALDPRTFRPLCDALNAHVCSSVCRCRGGAVRPRNADERAAQIRDQPGSVAPEEPLTLSALRARGVEGINALKRRAYDNSLHVGDVYQRRR